MKGMCVGSTFLLRQLRSQLFKFHFGESYFIYNNQKGLYSMEDSSDDLFALSPHWLEDQSNYQQLLLPREEPLPQLRGGSDLSGLAVAKQRFLNFAQELEGLKGAGIRADILEYSCHGFKNEKIREESFDYGLILRSVESRIEKMRKTRKIKKNWGEDDLKILIWIVSKYASLKGIANPQKQMCQQDWNFIATLIPGVTAESCMFKWLGLKKVTLAHNNWTVKESDILRKLVSKRTSVNPKHCSEIKDWKDVSQELYNLNEDPKKCYRNAKQCREHWTCYLSPKLKKGPWTLNEDLKLFRFIFGNKGSKRWSEIAKEFNGRTENALKNRYTLLIDKQRKHHRKSASELDLIKEFLERSELNQIMQPEYEEVSESERMQESSAMQREEREDYEVYSSKNNSKQESSQRVAPVRIQKIDLKAFQSINFDFWRSLQPCILESNGNFKKILRKETGTGQFQPIEENEVQNYSTLSSDALNGYFPNDKYDEFDEILSSNH